MSVSASVSVFMSMSLSASMSASVYVSVTMSVCVSVSVSVSVSVTNSESVPVSTSCANAWLCPGQSCYTGPCAVRGHTTRAHRMSGFQLRQSGPAVEVYQLDYRV
jgi:hypothetical protein